MTQREQIIIDQSLKGITARIIWGLIVSTAVGVTTLLTVYFGFKQELAIQKLEISILQQRVDKLENAK